MEHVTTLIVNYNTPKETDLAIRSAVNATANGFIHRVIVIDNGSKEPLKIAKDLQNKNIELIRSESNLGFTGGNNLGMSHAVKNYQTDYFFLLNSDAEVEKEGIQKLYESIKDDPKAGIAVSKIYFTPGLEFHRRSYSRAEKGKILWYAGGSIDWPNLVAYHRGVDEVDRGQFDQQTTCDFATGCALFVKRVVTEHIGILDKRFFLYSEDVDFSLRAKEAGYRIVFVPESIVWHMNGGSIAGGAGSKLQQYYQTRNRILISALHGTWRNKLTALRFATQTFLHGSDAERKGVMDFFLMRFGKQPIV
ncbi:glycosyltransferase family 2 protein [Candidatus Pacearchaeota archaeon]|nr:glycosyltransferase family 2 protein [Candidatus Pacearchaeota archaeon]